MLQDAAVIGKVFWLGALGAMEQQLHALEQKEFVQRARRSSVQGETEFAFKHLLVRDVAYGQILRADRAEKHVRSGEWIASLGRPEDHAEMVAHHYVNALELSRAAGQDIDELAVRTRDALGEAGDRAGALQALEQAERYYGDALALIAEDDPQRLDLLFRRGRAYFLRTGDAPADLFEAREGFRAAGDRERAAEVSLILAEAAWYEGDRDRAVEQLDEARSLVAGLPQSRVQAQVLVEVSRYDMLADRTDSAIAIGREALKMAEELRLDIFRANALNNIGSARVHSGDPEGIHDVEQAVVVAEQVKDIPEMIRAHNNLDVMHLVLGHGPESEKGMLEAHRLALHFGHQGFARWSGGGPVLAVKFQRGEWDEVQSEADEFLADPAPSYQKSSSAAWRGIVRVARGDLEGAQGDAELAMELARSAKDPQVILTVFGMAAVTFLSAGNETRAGETLDEILAEVRRLPQIGFGVVWAHGWAWVARTLSRSEELLDALKDEPLQTPWVDAGRAVVVGDFRQAADLLAEMGWHSFEMFYRLRAAEALVAEGRRAEADEQLRPALAFYRGVGATRYVREGEALLAATA